MSEGMLRFQQNIGRAALRLWPDLPRDLQEQLFEAAVGGDATFRHQLAIHLHEHHPKTIHPPKPKAVA
jgi:hypothetical protein